MDNKRIEPARPDVIARIWAERWGGLVVTPERTYRPAEVEGLALRGDDDALVALVTWFVDSTDAEIVTLDALLPGHGHGAQALTAAESELARRGVKRVHLITTNDNVSAISRYLEAGYRVTGLYLDSMDLVRVLKPGVPLTGENGLPLRDMWRLEKSLA